MAAENWKKQRKIESIRIFTKKYYIFCEGTKTEPNYFEGMKRQIERKGMYRNSVFINIEGVGEGTVRILEHAEKYIRSNKISEGEVWIIYDKDDFSEDSFNFVADRIKQLNQESTKIKYNAAWSNQCIEYWFILHFDYYVANNDRSFYIEYLNKKFKELGLDPYIKNDKEIFKKLENYGDPDRAVRFAQKRLDELKGLPDSKAVPATKVHLLYMQLQQFFRSE